MKKVTVRWVDSMTLDYGGWVDRDDMPLAEEQLLHETTGFLVARSDDVIVIAHSRNTAPDDANLNTRFAGVIVIPRIAVIRPKSLRKGA